MNTVYLSNYPYNIKPVAFYRTLLIDAILFNSVNTMIITRFFPRGEGATIFLYHLVYNKDYNTYLKQAELLQLDIDLFKNQLNWLLDNGFSFITIDELSNKVINGKDISSKLIAITFDDGFKITIENVLPILKFLKIKATFFITTNWINSNALLWQEKYFWYLANYGLGDVFGRIRQFDKKTFAGLTLYQCHRKFMEDILPAQKEALLRQYNRPIPDEKKLASNIYLSSEDVLRLDSAGMQIGSHSCGHYYMQNLPDDLYLQEMLKSKEKLEGLIKKPIESFSYPFNSYREDDEIIKKTGYKTLCTVNRQKVNKFISLTKLPRFDAPIRKILFKNSLRKIVNFKK